MVKPTTRAHLHSEWALRPWVLAGLLGFAGLVVHLLTDHAEDSGLRMALAALVGFGALAFAFTLDRDRWPEPAIYAAIVGLAIGGLVWRAVGRADDLAAEEYGIWAGIFAAGLSLPLFQAGFHRRRWRTSYADTHYHVWTDAISAGGALAFTGLSWLVLFLVSQLLDLVGIPLDELIDDSWFGWTFSGAAFGAALGVLRNQLKIIGTLQSLVLTVFSLLAVPVALAVVVFLSAVVVSGPGVLWDATDSATPLLLAIAAGSFVLVNAVIRDDPRGMSANPALRIAARVLALGILPLTVFAAISMGLRIDQHGLSPERLWGLAAIVVAVAYGVAYFFDVVRGWKAAWPDRLRASNLKLAVGTAAYALLMALPLFNFGAISASNQLARLESGAVPVDAFDFDALKWDFGAPGREALDRLSENEDLEIAQRARQARAYEIRPWRGRRTYNEEEEPRFSGEFEVYPEGTKLPDDLRIALEEGIKGKGAVNLCTEDSVCRIYFQGSDAEVIVLDDACSAPGTSDEDQVRPNGSCGISLHRLTKENGAWREFDPMRIPRMSPPDEAAALKAERDAIDSGDVTIRTVERRQVFIGDKPVGEPFE